MSVVESDRAVAWRRLLFLPHARQRRRLVEQMARLERERAVVLISPHVTRAEVEAEMTRQDAAEEAQ